MFALTFVHPTTEQELWVKMKKEEVVTAAAI